MPFPDSQYPSVARGYDKRQSERLLNAAPDLLAALKNVVRFEAVTTGMHQDVWLLAYAAIAKAEGRHGETD